MFQLVAPQQTRMRPALFAAMHRDRTEQFVVRNGWRLNVGTDGLERDEYDDDHTHYCVVSEGERHLASLRIRPEAEGSMVEAHFPDLWTQASGRLTGSHEVTRFCASDGLSPAARMNAVSDLLIGLCRHCIANDIPRFFAVVYPSVARLLKTIGWDGAVLARSGSGAQALWLCEWVPDEIICWQIQDRQFDRELSQMSAGIPADPLAEVA